MLDSSMMVSLIFSGTGSRVNSTGKGSALGNPFSRPTTRWYTSNTLDESSPVFALQIK